jgi:hypothetical protein
VNIQGTFSDPSTNEYLGDVQGTFREHSVNIQGTFREHSESIQGTFSDPSTNEYLGDIQGTFKEHSGNIQGTFRKHSGSIQGTFSDPSTNEYLGDIQGTFKEHSGNIQGTFREHSGGIQGTLREHSGNIQGAFREHSATPAQTSTCVLPPTKKHQRDFKTDTGKRFEPTQENTRRSLVNWKGVGRLENSEPPLEKKIHGSVDRFILFYFRPTHQSLRQNDERTDGCLLERMNISLTFFRGVSLKAQDCGPPYGIFSPCDQ